MRWCSLVCFNAFLLGPLSFFYVFARGSHPCLRFFLVHLSCLRLAVGVPIFFKVCFRGPFPLLRLVKGHPTFLQAFCLGVPVLFKVWLGSSYPLFKACFRCTHPFWVHLLGPLSFFKSCVEPFLHGFLYVLRLCLQGFLSLLKNCF